MPSFHWWRTVFWLIPAISVYTIVLGAAVPGVDARSIGGAGWRTGCARTWAWLILVTTGVRTAVRGVERVDRRAPCVFVSNHQSIYDIPVLFVALPVQLRIIAKASLGRFPVLGWAPALDRPPAGGPAPGPGASALKQVGRLMRRGSLADRVSGRDAKPRRTGGSFPARPVPAGDRGRAAGGAGGGVGHAARHAQGDADDAARRRRAGGASAAVHGRPDARRRPGAGRARSRHHRGDRSPSWRTHARSGDHRGGRARRARRRRRAQAAPLHRRAHPAGARAGAVRPQRAGRRRSSSCCRRRWPRIRRSGCRRWRPPCESSPAAERRQDSVAAGPRRPRATRSRWCWSTTRRGPSARRPLIGRVIDAAAEAGAAVPAVQATDTVKQSAAAGRTCRGGRDAPARAHPPGPDAAGLPHGRVARRGRARQERGSTRRTSRCWRNGPGYAVRLVEGDPENVKITTPADLDRASGRMARTGPGSAGAVRLGIGYDLHRTVAGRPLILGRGARAARSGAGRALGRRRGLPRPDRRRSGRRRGGRRRAAFLQPRSPLEGRVEHRSAGARGGHRARARVRGRQRRRRGHRRAPAHRPRTPPRCGNGWRRRSRWRWTRSA